MKRILIVEDDTSISELERDYLEVAGFETEIAGTAKRGSGSLSDGNTTLSCWT